MADAETNRSTVAAAFEAWQKGESFLGELFADRTTWRIEDSSLAAGSYADNENTYAWFLRMEDSQVVDGVAFFDGPAFDDLWTRVTP